MRLDPFQGIKRACAPGVQRPLEHGYVLKLLLTVLQNTHVVGVQTP